MVLHHREIKIRNNIFLSFSNLSKVVLAKFFKDLLLACVSYRKVNSFYNLTVKRVTEVLCNGTSLKYENI